MREAIRGLIAAAVWDRRPRVLLIGMLIVYPLVAATEPALQGTGTAFRGSQDEAEISRTEPEPRVRYIAPTGYRGLHWGDPITGLPPELGELHLTKGDIVAGAFPSSEPIESCTKLGSPAHKAQCTRSHPGGRALSLAYAEYSFSMTIGGEPLDTGGWVHPFLGFYTQELVRARAVDRDRLRLAAVRFEFDGSDQNGDADGLSNYERLLQGLISRFGPPEGYAEDGSSPSEQQSQSAGLLEHYRWCGNQHDDDPHTACSASVAFAYDHTSGHGVILEVTPAVYVFQYQVIHALSRDSTLREVDRYYAVLYQDPSRYARLRSMGTDGRGLFLCDRCGPEYYAVDGRIRRQLDVVQENGGMRAVIHWEPVRH